MKAGIELILRTGEWGQNTQVVTLSLTEDLINDLQEKVELSDEPWSILLASPGLYGGRGDAVTIRRKKFKMRAAYAKEIGRAVERALIDMFGVNDEVDGYRKDRLR